MRLQKLGASDSEPVGCPLIVTGRLLGKLLFSVFAFPTDELWSVNGTSFLAVTSVATCTRETMDPAFVIASTHRLYLTVQQKLLCWTSAVATVLLLRVCRVLFGNIAAADS